MGFAVLVLNGHERLCSARQARMALGAVGQDIHKVHAAPLGWSAGRGVSIAPFIILLYGSNVVRLSCCAAAMKVQPARLATGQQHLSLRRGVLPLVFLGAATNDLAHALPNDRVLMDELPRLHPLPHLGWYHAAQADPRAAPGCPCCSSRSRVGGFGLWMMSMSWSLSVAACCCCCCSCCINSSWAEKLPLFSTRRACNVSLLLKLGVELVWER